MRKWIVIFGISCWSALAAQTDPQFDQFWRTFSHFNPAFQYDNSRLFANVQTTNRMASYVASPVYNAAVNGYYDKFKSGFGASFYNYQLRSYLDENKYLVNYYYKFELPRAMELNVGASGGLYTSRINGFIPRYPGFPDHITDSSHTTTEFNLNIGGQYTWDNLTVLGSFTNLTSKDLSREFYLAGNYDHRISSNLTLKYRMLSQFTFTNLNLRVQPAVMGDFRNFLFGVSTNLRPIGNFNSSFIGYLGLDIEDRVQVLYSMKFLGANNGYSADFSIIFRLEQPRSRYWN